MTDIRKNYVSFHPSNWNSSKTDGQTTIQFIPSYWNLRKTDGQTTFHFTPFVDLDRQTIKARFISSLILGSKQDKRTNYVSFYHSYWDRRQTDGNFVYITEQKDKGSLILPLMLSFKTNRRTNLFSFQSSYWDPRQTDGQTTLYFIPHIGILVRRTEDFMSFPRIMRGST